MQQEIIRPAGLTDREFSVFKGLAEGKRIHQIAAIYKLSPSTVSTYRARVLRHLKASSNQELALIAHGVKTA